MTGRIRMLKGEKRKEREKMRRKKDPERGGERKTMIERKKDAERGEEERKKKR